MKKRWITIIICMLTVLCLAGCESTQEDAVSDEHSELFAEEYYSPLDDFLADCEEISADTLLRESETRFGEKITIKGKIVDALVLWFEGYPLVVSKYIDFAVNPRTVEKGQFIKDVSEEFSDVVGRTFSEIKYADINTAMIIFDNGSGVLAMSDNCMGDKWSRYRVLPKESIGDLPSNIKIEGIYFRNDRNYSKAMTHFEEGAVFIVCKDYTYQIFADGGEYEQHYLNCWRLNSSWTKGLKKTIKSDYIELNEVIKRNGKVVGYKFQKDNEYIYLSVEKVFPEVHIFLKKEPMQSEYFDQFDAANEKIT